MRLCVKLDPQLSTQYSKELKNARPAAVPSPPEGCRWRRTRIHLPASPLFFLGRRAYLTRRHIRSDSLLTKTVRNKADLTVTIHLAAPWLNLPLLLKKCFIVLVPVSVEKGKFLYQPSGLSRQLHGERTRKQKFSL